MAHPKYSEMVGKAISALKERGGSSRQAILKYIMANFNVGKDAKSVNAHLKLSLRAGVKNKNLRQSKGTGASGSFRIGEVKAAKKPAKAKKVVTLLGLLLLLYLPFFFANNPSKV
jgi:histone H1/5